MKLSFTPKTEWLFSALMICLFATQVQAQVPANNECTGAADINALFGQAPNETQNSMLFDNTNATSEASDPAAGFECFAERAFSQTVPIIENTLWFSFTGDGNIYFIETGDCGSANYLGGGDSQMAIYSGDCGNLTPVACSEDGPTSTNTDLKAGIALPTMAGVTYYVMVDGFNFNGALSSGEYCIQVTQQLITDCTDINSGTVVAADQFVCFEDTTAFIIEGVVIPNSLPDISGFRWALTAGPITGSMDPGGDPTYIGAFGQSDSPYTPLLVNDGTPIPFNNIAYFTPIVYAGAVDTLGGGFLEGLDFSGGCVQTGISVPVLMLGDNDPIMVIPYSVSASNTTSQDGEAGIDISGGSTLYEVNWENGEMTDTIVGLNPGDYNVTITDLSGCFDSLVTTVTVGNNTPEPDSVSVTFTVNLEEEMIDAGGVFIAGDFNDFMNDAMTNAVDDIYTFTARLEVGITYEYKFKNGPDGWENINDPNSVCTTGGYANRFIMVPDADTTLMEVCFNSCDSCIDVSTFSPEFAAAISLFPNPAKKMTFIDFNFSESTDLYIQLTSVTGQLIREEAVFAALNGRINLDLEDIASGVYFVQIRDAENLLTKRLVVE
ncbi:MAG: T9SS type A sorting domain-containing protein [Bacteroidota bacterium]